MMWGMELLTVEKVRFWKYWQYVQPVLCPFPVDYVLRPTKLQAMLLATPGFLLSFIRKLVSHEKRISATPPKKAAKTMMNNYNYRFQTDLFPKFRKKNTHMFPRVRKKLFKSIQRLKKKQPVSTSQVSPCGLLPHRPTQIMPFHFLRQTIWRRNLSFTQTLGIQSTNQWRFLLQFCCWETQRSWIHSDIINSRHTWHLCCTYLTYFFHMQ